MGNRAYVDLKAVRAEFGMSQRGFADLIGVSVRTVQSCEQGWRNPSAAVERAALVLLLGRRHGAGVTRFRCWETLDCSDAERRACQVEETRQGHLCWLLTGNTCRGRRLRSWEEKKTTCFGCGFFNQLFSQGLPLNHGPSGKSKEKARGDSTS